MDLGIKGRHALVCASSKGLGRACAMALAAEGVHVTLTARGDEALAKTAAEIRKAYPGVEVKQVAGDITTPAGREDAPKACPDPDILINNAGGPPPGDFRNWTRDDWIKAVDANMLTPIELIKATVDGMMSRKFGLIVNITSSAVKAPIDILGLSNGARAGLTGFVAGIARKTVKDNVTINGLLPGPFDTDRLRNTNAAAAKSSGQPLEEITEGEFHRQFNTNVLGPILATQEAAKHFGMQLPTYVLFTKLDGVPYFDAYTRNLSADEAREPLGAALYPDAGGAGTYADRVTPRIAQAFRDLFSSLADRRVQALSREFGDEWKPGAYEFVPGTPEQTELVEREIKASCTAAYESYKRMLEAGIAREVARAVLPVTTYSSMYVTMNARSLMNFLSLRTKREGTHFPSFPQREIEMVAEKMENFWAELMPLTYEAFNKNGRVAP